MCRAPKEDDVRGAESTGSAKGMMAGANLFGLINAVLTCVVLGIVATRGGDKTTKNYAATDAGYSICLLYTSPSPRDGLLSRMPSSA